MSPLIHGKSQLPLQSGKTLFEYADELALRVPTSCGRNGECHECIVEIRNGSDALSQPTNAENFLRGEYRLACQAKVDDPDADIEFQVLRRQPRILTESIKRTTELDPLTVREGNNIIFKGEDGPRVIDTYRGRLLGIAADIGTTTVAMNLVDLENGEIIYVASFENPQRFGGSDVMHRITYETGQFRGELQAVLVSSINFEIGEMVKTLKIRRRQIAEFVAVGNATMRDVLFGFDVEPIGTKPYKSVVELEYLDGKRETTAVNAKAQELGIRIHPEANVYGGPIIASHVGADVAADLLAVGIDENEDELAILLDVGTNTEIVAGNQHGLIAASCPAGPAFEGGLVTYAMPGYDGAIEKISMSTPDARPDISVIGNAYPIGICGSGLIDLLAELRRHDVMSELGVLSDGSNEFTFSHENSLTLSRRDISNLAQAKAANFCGQQIVLKALNININQYSRLYLAGGFANYINPANAIKIGFIPDMPQEKIIKVGNASLLGATMMLLSAQKRYHIESLVKTIQHIELETSPDFFDLFVEGCQFKPMPINL